MLAIHQKLDLGAVQARRQTIMSPTAAIDGAILPAGKHTDRSSAMLLEPVAVLEGVDGIGQVVLAISKAQQQATFAAGNLDVDTDTEILLGGSAIAPDRTRS